MSPRDAQLIEDSLAEPFSGYSQRPAWVFMPDLDRVAACVALLATMVLSAIALGSPMAPDQMRE